MFCFNHITISHMRKEKCLNSPFAQVLSDGSLVQKFSNKQEHANVLHGVVEQTFLYQVLDPLIVRYVQRESELQEVI